MAPLSGQQPNGGMIFARHEERVRSPFLPPWLLSQYRDLGIEPVELLRLVDKAGERRSNFERDVLRMEDGDRIEKSRTSRLGVIFSFVICMSALVALVIGFFVAPQQAAEVAKLVGPSGIVGLAAVYLGARWLLQRSVSSEHENELAKLRSRVERLEREQFAREQAGDN